MNELLSTSKESNGNYWDRYDEDNEMLSGWYQEVSKGQMHVTGTAYNIILSQSANYYRTNGMFTMNHEIIDSLINKNINWSNYDLWSGSNGDFYYEPDGYVDMIIKAHRTIMVDGLFYANAPGYCFLGDYSSTNNFRVDDNTYINDNYSNIGSGVTIVGTAGGPLDKQTVFNIAKHEIGHYWFGLFHSGAGVGIMGGGDIYLGGWESMKLGYLSSTTVDFGTTNYNLLDISSRYSNGEILQIPVSGEQYFIIENRRGVSIYDRTMLGDTAKGDFRRDVNDYGKGLYIYHYNSYYANDLECADGLWNWTYTEQTTPDWSNSQYMNVYEKNSIPQPLFNDNGDVSYYNKDGRTCGHYATSGASFDAWFGRGKRHETLYGEATDRIFTNNTDFWTSRENWGDRWDGWNVGYNEIFSPYSNPNTIDWDNNSTGIFLYYDYFGGDTAHLKIYKIGSGGYTLDSILKITPPSRPMGLKLTLTECDDGRIFPVLTWNHNTEPDMIMPYQPPFDYKRYKIFRAVEEVNNIPGNYTEIDDIVLRADLTPTYTDHNAYLLCQSDETNYLIRYKIKAVDNTSWASVYSDFVSTPAYLFQSGGDNPFANNNNPKNYSLAQNYPNPFNPVTKINFSIPKSGFVTLKIYDILGREIKTLVNEVKQPGYYTVDFNGSSLASGVYFYRIVAGNFINVKRMVLIK